MLLHPGEITDRDLAANLVAILFAAAGPIGFVDAAHLLDVPNDRLEDVLSLLDREPPLGLAVQRHDGRVQLTTAPCAASAVERYLGSPPPVRLSRAAHRSGRTPEELDEVVAELYGLATVGRLRAFVERRLGAR